MTLGAYGSKWNLTQGSSILSLTTPPLQNTIFCGLIYYIAMEFIHDVTNLPAHSFSKKNYKNKTVI